MAEITGYTVSVATRYDNVYTLTCDVWGPDQEPLLWRIADLLKADLETQNPTETYIARVTRHEKNDVALDAPAAAAPADPAG
jgi:hypothetical protein